MYTTVTVIPDMYFGKACLTVTTLSSDPQSTTTHLVGLAGTCTRLLLILLLCSQAAKSASDNQDHQCKLKHYWTTKFNA
uniref:Uncharacterized protein n=1 Tax=Anguilla anguilla TaxID=7936 RepID=A0A0E9X7I8_ANGAN